MSGGAVNLSAGRQRQLSAPGPQGRERTISCGVALATLRIVAADRGLLASYANEPTEVGGPLRQRLGPLFGEGVP